MKKLSAKPMKTNFMWQLLYTVLCAPYRFVYVWCEWTKTASLQSSQMSGIAQSSPRYYIAKRTFIRRRNRRLTLREIVYDFITYYYYYYISIWNISCRLFDACCSAKYCAIGAWCTPIRINDTLNITKENWCVEIHSDNWVQFCLTWTIPMATL